MGICRRVLRHPPLRPPSPRRPRRSLASSLAERVPPPSARTRPRARSPEPEAQSNGWLAPARLATSPSCRASQALPARATLGLRLRRGHVPPDARRSATKRRSWCRGSKGRWLGWRWWSRASTAPMFPANAPPHPAARAKVPGRPNSAGVESALGRNRLVPDPPPTRPGNHCAAHAEPSNRQWVSILDTIVRV